MIHASELTNYITDTLPQLRNEFSRGQQVFHSMHVLTDYTKRMALTHNFEEVKKSMALVEKIFKQGDATVQNAVENVFIFSFSSMRMLCNIVEWRIVQSFMSADLYNLYMHQVLTSNN